MKINGKAFWLLILVSLWGIWAAVTYLRPDSERKKEYLAILPGAIEKYIDDTGAEIGVAVIFNDTDTVAVNNDDSYPMSSVVKLFQAVAISEYLSLKHIPLDSILNIKGEELRLDTYSPLRDSIGNQDFQMEIGELLKFSLELSDNNASDILGSHILSPEIVDAYIKEKGYGNFNIKYNEETIHKNHNLALENNCTPLMAASVINSIFSGSLIEEPYKSFIENTLRNCQTGENRLSKYLRRKNIVVAHKTGTGFNDVKGNPQDVNDVGYVDLPDGDHYSIAIFVKKTNVNLEETEGMIAEISGIVYRHLSLDNKD